MTLDHFADHFLHSYPEVVGTRVLVALSGGCDSVALLVLLTDPRLELSLHAAYVDHRSRPAEAATEIALCRSLCERYGVPFHRLELPLVDEPARGREADWRAGRYAALLGHSHRLGISTVATAHHRDDVAEGVLVQLLRGAGPRGLAGIAAATAAGVIRPLLPWPRHDLAAWLEARAIRWCEDSSNRDLDHLRNLVRHRLLPTLEESAPGLRDHLVQLAATLADDDAFLSDALVAQALWIDPWHPDGGIPVQAVAGLPRAMRGRWLHAQAARIGLDRVSRRQIELMHGQLDDADPRSVTLGGRWRLRRSGGQLWLEPPAPAAPYRHTLDDGADTELPLPGWRVACGSAAATAPRPGWRALLSADGELSVRSPHRGERLPGSAVTVRSLLVRRLPRHLRSAWPVVCVNDTIEWIPGVWKDSTVGSRCTRPVEVYRR